MIHLLVFSLVFLIVGPALWTRGGIVLLDYVMTSHPAFSWSQPFMMSVTNLFPYLFGYEAGSKTVFVLILLVAGYLGVRMGDMLANRLGTEERWKIWLQSLGATFFLINPFAYERLMTQPGICLGILLLGYGVLYLVREPETYGKRNALLGGVCFGLAWSMFPHAIFMIALVFAAWILAFVRDKRAIGYLVLSGGTIILLNLNWLAAPLFGTANSVTSIAGFGNDNIRAFLSNALPPFGPIATNLSLYGFWGERYRHFLVPEAINPNWPIAAFAMVGLVAVGIAIALGRKDSRRYGWAFLTIATVSLVLGVGKASPLTAPVMDALYEWVPYFRGFREPQKWIGLLLLTYGFFFLVSVSFLLQKWGKHLFFRIGLVGSVFLLFASWAPGMLLGFAGQLKTVEYPYEFEALRTELVSSSGSRSTLILPWHTYMACPWTHGRIVANPVAAGLLSPAPLLQADNIEIGDILYTNSHDPKSSTVEGFIRSTRDFGPIRTLGADKILLMKCADWNSYGWLDSVPGCQKTRETPAYRLYQCP